MASALRTDPRCFRALAPADPVVVELREFSRIAEELGAERNRLTNRMREQLWRYFPAILELENDLGAEWLLDLWETTPVPAKAARIRDTTIAKLLERHRIRRFDAAHVLAVLRQPSLQVAAGTIEAASAHIATRIARIRLMNRQIKEAHHRLDALTARLIPTDEAEPGQQKQHDVEILASLPPNDRAGSGKDRPRPSIRQSGLAEAFDALQRRDYAAWRSLTGTAPVTKRSGKSCIVVRRQAYHDRLANALVPGPCTIGRASPLSTTPEAARNTPPCAAAVTATAAPYDPSPTASSTSPAPCSDQAPPSTPPSPLKKPLAERWGVPRDRSGEDRLHRRLHVVVDAARAGALEEGASRPGAPARRRQRPSSVSKTLEATPEGTAVRRPRRLLALARIGAPMRQAHEIESLARHSHAGRHPAVAEPHVRHLDGPTRGALACR